MSVRINQHARTEPQSALVWDFPGSLFSRLYKGREANSTQSYFGGTKEMTHVKSSACDLEPVVALQIQPLGWLPLMG